MNRADLRQLTDDRVLDAEILLDGGRWSAAYYLSGYAVECALKAIIAGQTQLHDFPNKIVAQKVYTHDLSILLAQAGLDSQLKLDTTHAANPTLGINWQVAKDWSEEARYQQKTEAQARKLHRAVTQNADGVLPWIKALWGLKISPRARSLPDV